MNESLIAALMMIQTGAKINLIGKHETRAHHQRQSYAHELKSLGMRCCFAKHGGTPNIFVKYQTDIHFISCSKNPRASSPSSSSSLISYQRWHCFVNCFLGQEWRRILSFRSKLSCFINNNTKTEQKLGFRSLKNLRGLTWYIVDIKNHFLWECPVDVL